MIGGASTNAGGNNTVRFGNARELMLGLEVVLPDGRVWDGLRALRKDNTGYALRHLFVGAEGTLGIITAAMLRLLPLPRRDELAFCAVRDEDAALALFRRFRDRRRGLRARLRVHVRRQHRAGAAAHRRGGAARGAGRALRDRRPRLLAGGRQAARPGRGGAGGRRSRRARSSTRPSAASAAQRRRPLAAARGASEAQMREGAPVRNDVSVPVAGARAHPRGLGGLPAG